MILLTSLLIAGILNWHSNGDLCQLQTKEMMKVLNRYSIEEESKEQSTLFIDFMNRSNKTADNEKILK